MTVERVLSAVTNNVAGVFDVGRRHALPNKQIDQDLQTLRLRSRQRQARIARLDPYPRQWMQVSAAEIVSMVETRRQRQASQK